MSEKSFIDWVAKVFTEKGYRHIPFDNLPPEATSLASKIHREIDKHTKQTHGCMQALNWGEEFYEMSIRALSAFIKIGKLGADITDIETLCKNVLEIFSKELDFENCSIMLKDADGLHLRLITGRGKGDAYMSGNPAGNTIILKIGEGIAGKVAETGEYIFIPDAARDKQFKLMNMNVEVGSLLSVPLKSEETIIGVINFSHPMLEAFNVNKIRLILLLSDYVGQMIALTHLHNKIAKWNEILRTLAFEKERLSLTLYSISDGVITTDAEEKIIFLNKAAEQYTGWTHEEAVGQLSHKVFCIFHGKTGNRCINPVEAVLKTGEVARFTEDTILIDRSGVERAVVINCTPVVHEKGDIIGAVLAFREAKGSTKLEQEMIKEQKLESVGILAGGIAHDFNNILTAILANISLARLQLKPDDPLYRRLEDAEKASLRATDLTQQLLTFSKGGSPVKETTSIVELIEDSARFALRGSNVKCEFHLPQTVWPIEADEGQMSQVINNLVINADQAMPEGGTITISAENVVVKPAHALPLKNGKYVKISIKDQGTGIPAEHLQKIFDPYFTTKQKGSGLGLSVTYSIIKNHDGYITVESELGVGTTFHIYLPSSQKRMSKKKSSGDIPVSGKGKILLMDDEDIIRDAVGEILGSLGYTVELVRDGAEAVAVYQTAKESGYPFDAVIMDLTIPGGMGGKEALKKMKAIDPSVKAIVSSGYSHDPIMADYRKYGFMGVITKPYKVKQLSEEVHRVIKSIKK
jgi:PAS domain S-box-containing protein